MKNVLIIYKMETNRKKSARCEDSNDSSEDVVSASDYEKYKAPGCSPTGLKPAEMVRLSNLQCRNCKNRLWEDNGYLVKYWCEKCNEFGWW